jgi:hypothetical protein
VPRPEMGPSSLPGYADTRDPCQEGNHRVPPSGETLSRLFGYKEKHGRYPTDETEHGWRATFYVTGIEHSLTGDTGRGGPGGRAGRVADGRWRAIAYDSSARASSFQTLKHLTWRKMDMLPSAATGTPSTANSSLVMAVSHAAHVSPRPDPPHTRGSLNLGNRPSWSLVRISARRTCSSKGPLLPHFRKIPL